VRFRGGTIEQKNGVGYIYLLDVNDDGRPDLVSSMGHDFGVLWMENLGGATGASTSSMTPGRSLTP